jgi:hypothetical protein
VTDFIAPAREVMGNEFKAQALSNNRAPFAAVSLTSRRIERIFNRDSGSASNPFNLCWTTGPRNYCSRRGQGNAGLIGDVSKTFLGGHGREGP